MFRVRLSEMKGDVEKRIDRLLEKYKLYSNSLFHQTERMQKRSNSLWLIQAALFVAFYVVFKLPIKFLPILVCVIAAVVNAMWFFVMQRSRASTLLQGKALRDIESELESLEKKSGLKIDMWTIDKKCMRDKKIHIFPHSKERFALFPLEEVSVNRIFQILPLVLLLFWVVALLLTVAKLY